MTNDRAAGRAAPPAELAAALRRGSAAFLEGALLNPSLEARHLIPLLSNPAVTPALIEGIGRSPVWMKFYRVRATLVLHPRAPRPLAMSLLSHLRWRNLARTAEAPQASMPLRNAAEKVLVLRLPELVLGERVTLARTATGPVLNALRRDPSAAVVRALLENPRLRVDDALFMAGRPEATAPVLAAIAESPRFSANQDLRLAVAGHPSTPAATALRLVQGMDRAGLIRLVDRPGASPLVAMAAGRRLDALPPAASVQVG